MATAIEPTESEEIKLDELKDSGFTASYRSLPEKPATTIRFFDRTDFYTVHGADALFLSKDVFKTAAVLRSFGSGVNKLEYCSVNKSTFESVCRDLLLVKQYRVEVYKNKSNKQDWKLCYKGSPGNLIQFEDLLFNNNELSTSVITLGLKITEDGGQKMIGAGYADATLRTLGVSQFCDNDQFSNLESFLVQLGPKECLVCSSELTDDLAKVIERSGVLLTQRKKGEFTNKDAEQDLDRLLKKKSTEASSIVLGELDKTTAIAGLSAVISYLELLLDTDNFGQYSVHQFDLTQYVRLDSAAVTALNLFPDNTDGTQPANQSVFGLLNRCRTPQGQRLLSQWVKQPLVDKNKIEDRLNMVECLVQENSLRQSLSEDLLRHIPDLQKLAKRFQRKKATLQDCYRIYQAIGRLPSIVQALENHDGEHKALIAATVTGPLKETIVDFNKFVEMVESTLDMEQVENYEYLIRSDFDEKLQELRQQLNDVEAEMAKELKKVARDLGLEASKTIKLEQNSQLGFFFRVTRKDEKSLRNNKRYEMIDTNKNGVRFRNASLRDANESYLSMKEEYQQQQQTVVDEILKIAAGYVEPMLQLNDVVAQMDVLVSFSLVACSAPDTYTRPVIKDMGSGVLSLKQARHPCLEMQDDVCFIPNDVVFNRETRMFNIITGPNMGGKSTYIRSVGVIVLMSQIGSFVPCSSGSEISLVDGILARVGAGDCQLKGVSTFMAEMLETAAILRAATDKSLIIIDELGRGTSTYDGFGLAWAISHYIATQIQAMCMFATHYHELTALADELPSVHNLHVTALTENNAFTLLYKVKEGVCDQSFGIQVAQLAHFPQHVIQFAKDKAKELEDYQNISLSDQQLDGDEETAVKKRKIAKEDGMAKIEDFFSQLKSLPATGASDTSSSLQDKVEQLKHSVISANNPYINDLLARSAGHAAPSV